MMSRAQVALLQLSLLAMALTGLAFAWMKYFMKSDDPFAVVNHPLQRHAKHPPIVQQRAAVDQRGHAPGLARGAVR